MIRLLLVDDQVNVLQALRMRLELESDIDVVGEARNGIEALEQALSLNPDAIVMDVEMPVMDGIAATQLLTAQDAHIPIIILSLFDDSSTRLRALQAGAACFLAKSGGVQNLLGAIRRSVS